ncbi:MAG: hypothetical protein Q8M95_05165 [Candidatus Methanoperedens sp.]|nr:hypothetical protein [Candidatus Methanoperedens sp.]
MENHNLPEVIREFQITATDGKNFTFQTDEKLYAPRRELVWSHYRMILPTEEEMSEWKEIITTRTSKKATVRKANYEASCCAISADSMGREYHKESEGL